jgi:hypothetical protein
MSQYTGALTTMLLFHRTELVKFIRHPRPVQNIYKQVPVFQAMPYILRTRAPATEISMRTFEVPIEGDGTHHETDKREGRKHLIRRAHGGSRTQFD